jgi:hypothetical protein
MEVREMENYQELFLEENHSRVSEIKEEIRERFPKTKWVDVAQEPLWFGRSEMTRIPGKAIVGYDKDGESHYYATASEDYFVLPNEVAVWMALEEAKNYPEYGKPVAVMDHVDGKMFAHLEFPEFEHKELVKGDPLALRVDIYNSYDLSRAFEIGMSMLRLVCTNGMKAWLPEGNIAKKRHYGIMAPWNQIKTLGDKLDTMSIQFDLWKSWTEKQIGAKEVDAVFGKLLFSEKQVKTIRELAETGTETSIDKKLEENKLTVWDLNNSMTQFVSHEIESEIVKDRHLHKIARVIPQVL